MRMMCLAMALQRQPQRREVLTELVVQVARNPRPLVFLCRDESRQQLRHVLLGPGLAEQLGAQSLRALLDARLELGHRLPLRRQVTGDPGEAGARALADPRRDGAAVEALATLPHKPPFIFRPSRPGRACQLLLRDARRAIL